jgi:hypothetical protein
MRRDNTLAKIVGEAANLRYYFSIMSATELIKHVAALPAQERTAFEELFHAMRHGTGGASSLARSNWPDFGERLRSIYGDRVAPDSQPIIDEGRGDQSRSRTPLRRESLKRED